MAPLSPPQCVGCVRDPGAVTEDCRSVCFLHTPSIAFRHLPPHSEHRFPAPSSTLRRASLSGTFLHTPTIAFRHLRHLPPHSAEHRFPAPSSTLRRASLSGTFLHTPSIAFRHLPPHSEHGFPAPSSTLRASLSGTFLQTLPDLVTPL